MARNDKEILWFGMKVTPDEKEKIKKLAEHYNISQKEAVMNLVEDRVADISTYSTVGKKSRMLQFAGIIDGEPTLSTDKSHLEDYGRSSLG